MKKVLGMALAFGMVQTALIAAEPCAFLGIESKEEISLEYVDCTGKSTSQELQSSAGETVSWAAASGSGAKVGSMVNVIWKRLPIHKNVASVQITDKGLSIDCTTIKKHFNEVCSCSDGHDAHPCPTNPNVTR